MVSDRELVLQCLNGDDRAWAQFVEDYRGPVYGVCCKFSSSDQDVEDLMQEAFIKIWANLGTYVPARGTLRGWVTAIARNAGIDRYRKNADQRKTSSIDESLPQSEITPLEQFVDSGPSALDIVATGEMAEIVRQVAKEIPPDMWQAVSMKFLHELDNYEIARRLRIPEGTVKSRINRGRTHLATLLHPMRLAFGAV